MKVTHNADLHGPLHVGLYGVVGDVEVVCLQHESFLLTETELIVDNLGVPSIRIQKCEV